MCCSHSPVPCDGGAEAFVDWRSTPQDEHLLDCCRQQGGCRQGKKYSCSTNSFKCRWQATTLRKKGLILLILQFLISKLNMNICTHIASFPGPCSAFHWTVSCSTVNCTASDENLGGKTDLGMTLLLFVFAYCKQSRLEAAQAQEQGDSYDVTHTTHGLLSIN